MTARDIILRELQRIGTRVPPWLAAEGAPRGRLMARELDAALRRHRPCAPGSACRILRALRAEGVDVRCVDASAGVYQLGPGWWA